MAVEGPVAMWLIGLTPDSKVNAAAFLIVMGVAIFIESPVIDLLSTGTTLGVDKARFNVLTRFTLWTMAWVTVAHCVVVFTPLYGWVATALLGARPEVAEAAWPGLACMPFWSAAVGWRRYLQGIMIRAGVTRPISWGTLVRIAAMVGVGWGLTRVEGLPGLAVVGLALSAAVFAEAVYIHIVSRPVVRSLPERDDSAEPVSFGRIFRFHAPLTLSTMLMLSTPLFMSRSLASAPDPVVSMAAWQTAGTLLWLFRTVTFALPEAVIALYRVGRERVLWRFCAWVGGVLSAAVLGFHLTGWDMALFRGFFQSDAAVAERAALAFVFCAPLPVLGAVMNYYRGLLTAHHVTSARLVAITAALGGLLVSLWVLGGTGWPGVVVAAVALGIGQTVELTALVLALWRWTQRNDPSPDLIEAGTA